MSAPRLAVVVACTRPERIGQLVAPLAAAVERGEVEVAVAGDVAAVDATTLGVAVVPVVELHANARRNAAIARTTAPLVAFLDDDAVPEPGWLAAALAVDPDGAVVVTGPEVPARDSPGALLAHSVCSSVVAEGTRAHTATVAGEVAWHEVPFCNCVVPRSLIDAAGLPSTTVPWDADDFEFFGRVRSHATFRTEPTLLVAHDRYPDRITDFLAGRWRLRQRAGEKLVALPELYLAVPATALAGAVPLAGLAVLAVAGRRRRQLVAIGASAYGIALATTVPGAVRRTGWRRLGAHLATLVGLHVVSVAGVQVGLWRALLGRPAGPPPPRR